LNIGFVVAGRWRPSKRRGLGSFSSFADGAGALWWAGLAVVIVSTALLAVSTVSVIVRRLHDLGLSGYHAISVAATALGGALLSCAPDHVQLLTLPLAICGCCFIQATPGPADLEVTSSQDECRRNQRARARSQDISALFCPDFEGW
jgi:uncharacterized membrane protein YhaH (DUF805 family)